MRVEFTPSPAATVGAEWELGLVNPVTLDLVSAADAVLAAVPADPTRPQSKVTRELLANTIELITGVCHNAVEVVDDLGATLLRVRRAVDALRLELFCAGSHPFARWDLQDVTEGSRYATLIDRTQWWGRQMLIYGLHVHVGITSAAKVLPLLNAMLTYQPHLQALSASSPFWAGQDTGYASNRALMFQQLPTAGLPFQFQDWAEYEAYLTDAFQTGVLNELGELRWDLRPAPALGTLEVRVCDGPPTLFEVGALTALTHCLVLHLERQLDAGTLPPMLPPWHVQENKWRAARYGLDAEIILDTANRERLVTEDLIELLDRLEPVADRLGCRDQLHDVEVLLSGGASYQRQRAVAAATGGDLQAVAAHLVRELRAGSPWPGAHSPTSGGIPVIGPDGGDGQPSPAAG